MTNMALVTEKPGQIVAGRCRHGHKQAGLPACRRCRLEPGRACWTLSSSPDFAGDQLIYLTYSEPSTNGGSGLALARAKLVAQAGGAAPRRADGAVARPCGRRGRPVRRAHRLCPRRQIAVPELRRAPALHAGAGPQPAARQDPSPDARRQAGAGQSAGRTNRRGDASPSPIRPRTPKSRSDCRTTSPGPGRT